MHLEAVWVAKEASYMERKCSAGVNDSPSKHRGAVTGWKSWVSPPQPHRGATSWGCGWKGCVPQNSSMESLLSRHGIWTCGPGRWLGLEAAPSQWDKRPYGKTGEILHFFLCHGRIQWNQETGYPQTPCLRAPSSWTSYPLELWETNMCCVSRPVCGLRASSWLTFMGCCELRWPMKRRDLGGGIFVAGAASSPLRWSQRHVPESPSCDLTEEARTADPGIKRPIFISLVQLRGLTSVRWSKMHH